MKVNHRLPCPGRISDSSRLPTVAQTSSRTSSLLGLGKNPMPKPFARLPTKKSAIQQTESLRYSQKPKLGASKKVIRIRAFIRSAR